MKRKFLANLGFFLVLNLIIKPIYVFGIDLVVQNTVGSEVYGKYFTLFNIAIIFQIFLDLGIENFIRRDIARHPERTGSYFYNIIILKLLLLVPYMMVCVSLAIYNGIESDDYWLLFLILLNQFLASLILYIRANFGGLQLFKTESIISVLDRSLMIIIVGTLLLHPITKFEFRIIWFVIAQTISYAIALIIGLILLLKKTDSIDLRINLSRIFPIIKKLSPFALLILLMASYSRSDSILLGILLPDGNEQAGIFAHGFRIIDFMSNYALLFPILLIPIFSKHIFRKEKVDSLLQFSSLLLIIPSLAAIAPAIVYRHNLFDIFLKEHVVLSADVFSILTVSYLGMCISFTFGALLTANGNLKVLNIMAAFALLLYLGLSLILIPRYHVIGAAIANASTQFFTIIVQIALVWKIFRLKLNVNILIKIIIYIILIIAGGYLIHSMNLNWIIGFFILLLCSLILASAIGLISIKSIRSILQERI